MILNTMAYETVCYFLVAIKLYCDTKSRILTVQRGAKPLSEPSVPSLRSYGSMRSRCILDGYEAFLTMHRSSPARMGCGSREAEALLEAPSG